MEIFSFPEMSQGASPQFGSAGSSTQSETRHIWERLDQGEESNQEDDPYDHCLTISKHMVVEPTAADKEIYRRKHNKEPELDTDVGSRRRDLFTAAQESQFAKTKFNGTWR